jgi:hypothetical protein
MTTLKDLEKMKFGDEIVCDTPFLKDDTYAYVGKMSWGSHAFVNLQGSTLQVQEQETIDNFNVRIIDESHEKWNPDLNKVIVPYSVFFDGSLKDEVPL